VAAAGSNANAKRLNVRNAKETVMFGTIGRAELKPGQAEELTAMMEEWKHEIRPKIPGAFVELMGHRAGQPNQIVFLALAQDEATYRKLAELPEQDAFYRKLASHFQSEPTWEDVEMEWGIRE
jgi:hypothetical protein